MLTELMIKQRIARQFSRAAPSYDELADVQWRVGRDALGRLAAGGTRVLDIGAGTGRISRRLADGTRQIIGMDLALGMMQHAARQFPHIQWLAGDAEHIPLADGSVDRIFSSMALQWCQQPEQVFRELKRVLSDDGSGLLAIMVEGSFHQWQHCWQQLESPGHINTFPRVEQLRQQVHQVGLKADIQCKEYLTWHQDVQQLLRSVKGIGANVVTDKPRQPLSRHTLTGLQQVYGQFADRRGRLPLSYQICFIEIHK